MRDSVYCGAEAKRAREFESEILPGVEIMRVAGRLGGCDHAQYVGPALWLCNPWCAKVLEATCAGGAALGLV